MLVTLLGIATLVSPSHSWNADAPTLVRIIGVFYVAAVVMGFYMMFPFKVIP